MTMFASLDNKPLTKRVLAERNQFHAVDQIILSKKTLIEK